ncbi:TPA: hypothetical protein RPW15_001861 [Campylobacter fetus subsp. venerealis]|uniref:Uncharacterized protein n=1 Tax=Campylobacter fetus subsp. venerealis NCTC 10354 TaxID=983328 RepID=A0AAE6M9J9_CAMFE|nr:hypothetical protein [Campylobacter fetus]OCS25330.1 hypothetical protein CFVB10_09010 [Campylobacter fetus subsp. venerealis cfvB10]OCS29073.1 hypothetical protein CFVCCUG33900_08200 [Campylobacter fetus subsp. venerealis LMG 6570 = CCUG 33900]AIR80157.1 hypothetical protein CFV97608_0494 [Campylobacter fetus subsp. venerealis 97/608]EAK0836200.1 hypothetical protein [Campylobacter fetus]EGU23637.1 Hypothetical protein CFV354_0550 [Campylobacter fetus subsp. venerealis NCTC 10354]
MCYMMEREIKKERQSKNMSNLALILNDLDEMIEELSEAISVDDEQEIYENAKALVEYYYKTKKSLKLD